MIEQAPGTPPHPNNEKFGEALAPKTLTPANDDALANGRISKPNIQRVGVTFDGTDGLIVREQEYRDGLSRFADIRIDRELDLGVDVTTFFRGRGASLERELPGLRNDSSFMQEPHVATTQFVLPVNVPGDLSVELLLFNGNGSLDPMHVIGMREANVEEATGGKRFYQETGARRFSVCIEGIKSGTHYAFRITDCQHVSPHRWLLDPYGLASSPGFFLESRSENDRGPTPENYAPPKSVIIDRMAAEFAVERITPLLSKIEPFKMRIYEGHVYATLGIPDALLAPRFEGDEDFRGTQGKIACLGSPAWIEYLKSLDRNVLQLMPLQASSPEFVFNRNEWNYNPDSLFALKASYFYTDNKDDQIRELHQTIDRLHKSGIAVVADCVFGHTSENCDGEAQSLRAGIDKRVQIGANQSYRVHDKDALIRNENGDYVDFTDCGHTISFDGARGAKLADQLGRWWLDHLGFDGLRLDQAPVLARSGVAGNFNKNSYALAALVRIARENGKIIIAEPCDGGGHTWQSHEKDFPDSIIVQKISTAEVARNFVKRQPEFRCDHGHTTLGALAVRVQSDSGVRFAGVHDGLTVRDHASQISKDLIRDSLSRIDEKTLERRIVRALRANAALAPGAEMIGQGEEVGKSNNGDHNAFTCANSVTLEWAPTGEAAEMLSYTQRLSRLAKDLPTLTSGSINSLRMTAYPTCEFVGPDGLPSTVADLEAASSQSGGLLERAASSAFGALYTRNQGGLHGYLSNSENLPAPVMVVRSNEDLTDFILPDVRPHFCWVKVFDSSSNEPFTAQRVTAQYNKKPHELLRGPGVYAYSLYRSDDGRP